MAILHYVEIENFKTFSGKIHIELSHPAVIIGPNNSGKTSVIQALSLWDRGVKSWVEKKGDTNSTKERERYSAGINRLNILEVPVGETRFFWNGTRVRQGKGNVKLTINLGIEYKGKVVDCPFFFTYRDPEVIYSRPDEPIMKDLELIKYASGLNFNMLYPMSGIESEETIFHDGWIKKLLGQGQTAQVLRNICYRVAEADNNNGTHDWGKITALMRRLFLVHINRPVLIESKGSIIVVTYRPENNSTVLDISLAGRGLQQVLLILAYIYWHKNSIILIDEPDAHLEILRQRQVFAILKKTAEENGSQVIIATHSEAILDDAVDTNLTLLFLNGTVDNLANKRDMRNALRTYGIEHYYKAKVHPRIFYIEGSTDIVILRELAVLLGHKRAEKVLSDKLNPYYTQNIEPEDNLENQLDRAGGAFNRNHLDHFNALKAFVPELKGFALFDGDNKNRTDIRGNTIITMFWKEYEIENYFINPEVLIKFIEDRHKKAEQDLFMHEDVEIFIQALNEVLLSKVFDNSSEVLEQYYKGGKDLKRLLFRNTKMSEFAEEVFRRYAEKMNQPILLAKGEFYRLVPFCPAEEIPKEVPEKLDMLVQYLEFDDA
ncbi:MAG: AAA family ATPase [Treponema sp.]|jgi:predicted ATPase|nr:AAA family ATPase [Treponema sp.]